jgi:RimJ/RimL family protein N-acetyltransferase
MSVALQLLIEKFFVPYMNVHRLTGTFYDHNTASRRVFEKNGFKFMGITPDVVEIAESKTGVKGKRVGLGMMFWERKTSL